ncbi:hypothetical protein, partial [Frankia sp. CiP3]|uniref:hypothetical protein n=1 Tax=Frankia sp. CiP3 TaxID=2880971 RepID=UPI001EF55B06
AQPWLAMEHPLIIVRQMIVAFPRVTATLGAASGRLVPTTASICMSRRPTVQISHTPTHAGTHRNVGVRPARPRRLSPIAAGRPL